MTSMINTNVFFDFTDFQGGAPGWAPRGSVQQRQWSAKRDASHATRRWYVKSLLYMLVVLVENTGSDHFDG